MRYLILCMTLILAGCAAGPELPEAQRRLFPPMVAMEQGDYDVFFTENQTKQLTCEEDMTCAMVLFNLGFVYAYPLSPYYDAQKALPYFDALLTKHAHTPWAFQGRWWKELLQKNLSLEAVQERLQAELQTHKDISARETALRAREIAVWARETAARSQETVARPQEVAVRSQESVLRVKEATIRSQDAKIRGLQGRLDRSRDIDAQIDKKERELLH